MAEIEDGDTVEVQGGSGRYQLKRLGDVYSCNCPAWLHQGIGINQRTCKHLRAYLGDEFEAARVGVAVTAAVAQGGIVGSRKGDGSAPPVLLAHKWETDHDPTGWWMSEKLDGIRAYWDGDAFVSRLGNRFAAPPWFVEHLPANTLDGELWVGRKMFQKTTSIVRSGAAGEAWKQLRYVVFDAPDFAGPFEDRTKFCRDLLGAGLPFARWHDHVRCDGLDHLRAELARVEALGGEGLMLRRPGSKYEPGRSQSLLKVKTFHDAEAIVRAHEPGKGKHKGRLGALVCQLPDGTQFNVGTGFTDAERGAPPPVGTVITFRYQELSDDGVPRFPSYVGVRLDFAWPGPGAGAPAKGRGNPAGRPQAAVPTRPAPATAAAPPRPAPRPPGTRLALDADGRKVETHLVLDGPRVGMRAVETFASEKAAKRALADLKAALISQGYEED